MALVEIIYPTKLKEKKSYERLKKNYVKLVENHMAIYKKFT
jgi:hypothetical protein